MKLKRTEWKQTCRSVQILPPPLHLPTTSSGGGFITLTCAEQRRPRYQAKIAQKADKESGKLKKERDYHRLAHRRVQEENKELQREIARLHQHYEGVEEHNSELQGKYESVKRTFACYFPSRITLPASPCSPLSRLLVAPFQRYPPS